MKAFRFAIIVVVALPACSLAGGSEAPSAETARRRSLEYGVLALEAGDYRAAIDRIAPVAAICPTDGVGRSAMLLLATAELDPRNQAGRADVAAELAAFQLARRSEGEWEGALAAHLYTLALDYGASPIAADDVPDAGVLWARYLSDPEYARSPLGVATPDTGGTPPVALATAGADSEAQVARVQGDVGGGPVCDVPEPDENLVLPELGRVPLAARAEAPVPASGEVAPAPTGDSRELQAEVERLRAELARKEQELDRIRRTLRP